MWTFCMAFLITFFGHSSGYVALMKAKKPETH